MTDMTSDTLPRARRKDITWEYRFYFAIIFLISLPLTLVIWALGLAQRDSEDADKGFIANAWRRAAIITPMIFSA